MKQVLYSVDSFLSCSAFHVVLFPPSLLPFIPQAFSSSAVGKRKTKKDGQQLEEERKSVKFAESLKRDHERISV